jgi:hypothetical protein
MFVADYGSGWSFSSAQVADTDHRPAAGNAFNRLIEISTRGGLGTIKTQNDEDDIIAVGKWFPNCVTLREVEGTRLKGAQMGQYGLLTPGDARYEDIEAVYSGGSSTVDVISDERELIVATIDELASQGQLRSPAYQ